MVRAHHILFLVDEALRKGHKIAIGAAGGLAAGALAHHLYTHGIHWTPGGSGTGTPAAEKVATHMEKMQTAVKDYAANNPDVVNKAKSLGKTAKEMAVGQLAHPQASGSGETATPLMNLSKKVIKGTPSTYDSFRQGLMKMRQEPTQ